MNNILWKAIVAIATTGAAWAARKAATGVWSQVSDTEPPPNPEDPDVTWKSAMGWAALAGVTAGVARVLARRGASAARDAIA